MRRRHHERELQHERELIRCAQRLASHELKIRVSVLELQTLAAGRSDLLASAAGAQIGAYLAEPRAADPHRLLAGTLLILAGADQDLIEEEVEAARRWTAAPAEPAV